VDSAHAEFERFYAAHYQPLVRTLLPVVLHTHVAEEVAQEAFLRAYREWSKISRYDDPRGWLYRVAMRIATSRWRRLRSAAAAIARYGPPAVVEAVDETSLTVLEALRRLPLPQRQALVMHHMLGIPVAEIAAELGVAVGTVKARLSRGRVALAPALADLREVSSRG
jgi:RNA polymerase sigma-70 factor (ECF subfamily)